MPWNGAESPGRDHSHQNRNVSSKDEGDATTVCTDLQRCSLQKEHVSPNHVLLCQ